jgi:hypothetical protein
MNRFNDVFESVRLRSYTESKQGIHNAVDPASLALLSEYVSELGSEIARAVRENKRSRNEQNSTKRQRSKSTHKRTITANRNANESLSGNAERGGEPANEAIPVQMQQHNDPLEFGGCLVYDVGGNGDCGPHCVSAFFQRQITYKQVRRDVCVYRGWNPVQIEDDISTHRWWDDQDLQAASYHYDIRIHVHNPSDPNAQFTIIEPFHSNPNRRTMLLYQSCALSALSACRPTGSS